MIIVGKATPNKERNDIELYLQEFNEMLEDNGKCAYAWSFNPDEQAIEAMQECLDNKESVYIYLPSANCRSNLKMKIVDFRHNRQGLPECPEVWQSYCINDLKGVQVGKHIWFLIDSIMSFYPSVDLAGYSPVFNDKYRKWGQNSFAFLNSKTEN